jgi:sec-independent protein translocase protein TatA
MGNLGGWEIVIILGVLVLLFGARRLPDMARSIGQSARVFKGEMKGLKDDDEKAPRPRTETSQEPVVEKRTETPGPAAQ